MTILTFGKTTASGESSVPGLYKFVYPFEFLKYQGVLNVDLICQMGKEKMKQKFSETLVFS